MHTTMRIGAAAVAVLTAAGISAGTASAAERGHSAFGWGADRVVFAQTDATTGNQVVAYHRGDDGRLTPLAAYDTGGLGGVLGSSVVDHLASQGSLTYDREHQLLYAVNAGSDTVSVFAVHGDRLWLRQTLPSGGTFPVSVAVHDDAVYVLNALNGGSVQGYTVEDGRLRERRAWNRPLGLDPNATPQFTNTPGQVGFADRGRKLVVTTKANGDNVDVFALDEDGAPAPAPVVTNLPGAVPFAFVTGPDSRTLYLTEAGPNAVASFRVNGDGTLTPLQTAATGQSATCWITAVGDLLYVSNAGSATVSIYRAGEDGSLQPIGTAATDPGTVDSAASHDGRYLYVQTGGQGILDGYAINRDGTLRPIGSETVPNAVGGEGIVAA
ncbi:beta-propeller fold lactonase family protein [Catenulispora sp. NL8]|uniref:Beta-propeller fold lactonase family protein n=1 Tax=Catenulispora pinistramenti TaxID=2705254 RepID=A0ABS5KHQ8_9ACTN|nr:beta-propeller fold lactonase family protein [Catenulispora pinistramenti]MBS2545623.1 beta-propeller fold lactonase family protein [Catenulispora pinistramenti]